MNKWRCTTYVLKQIKKGGEPRGNGCGAKGSSKLKIRLLTHSFGFDFHKECNTHDEEYRVPYHLKSPEHKALADDYLEFNLRLNIKNHQPTGRRKWAIKYILPYRYLYNNYKEKLPVYYHAAVTVGGDNAYWFVG